MTTSRKVFETVPMAGRSVEIADSIGRVNLDNLREEWESNGAEVVWLGIVAAHARRAANNAKVTLDVTLAKLDQEIRTIATARAEKLTEAGVTAAIRLHPAYVTAHETYYDAIYAADVAESAKYAAVQKQKNLGKIGDLLAQEEAARRGAPPSILSTRPKRQPV